MGGGKGWEEVRTGNDTNGEEEGKMPGVREESGGGGGGRGRK